MEVAQSTADGLRRKIEDIDSELAAQEEYSNSEKLRRADYKVSPLV